MRTPLKVSGAFARLVCLLSLLACCVFSACNMNNTYSLREGTYNAAAGPWPRYENARLCVKQGRFVMEIKKPFHKVGYGTYTVNGPTMTFLVNNGHGGQELWGYAIAEGNGLKLAQHLPITDKDMASGKVWVFIHKSRSLELSLDAPYNQ